MLHCDLIDVSKRSCAAGSFDRFHGDVLNLLLRISKLLFERRDLRLVVSDRFFQCADAQFTEALLGLGILLENQDVLLETRFGFLAGAVGCGVCFRFEALREGFGIFLIAGEFLLAFLQSRFAQLPVLFDGFLPLVVLLFLEPDLFVVLVLGFFAFLRLAIFEVLGLPLPLFLQGFFLFFPLAFRARNFLFPRGAPSGDFRFEILLLLRVILHKLIERGGCDVDLVQPAEFPAFQFNSLAYGGEELDFFRQLAGQACERPGDFETQPRDALHGGLDGDAFDGVAHFGFVAVRGLFDFRIGGFARVRGLFLDLFELALDLGLGALRADGCFGFDGHGLLTPNSQSLTERIGRSGAGWLAW